MAPTQPDPASPNPLTEGARARALGRPKDACPYPAGSRERTAWLEGFDGAPADRPPDAPQQGH